MAVHVIKATGLNCPQPVLRLATESMKFKPGDQVEISGDCSTFEKDCRSWCLRMHKTILEVVDMGNNAKLIKIQI